jgi:electron transfer flavoprotein beta subunit
LEGGLRAVLKIKLPAVLSCQLGLNVPRYPTLPNIMKARSKELLSFPVGDFLKEESRINVEKIYPPARKGQGLVLEGEVGDLADKLVAILKEKTTVLR